MPRAICDSDCECQCVFWVTAVTGIGEEDRWTVGVSNPNFPVNYYGEGQTWSSDGGLNYQALPTDPISICPSADTVVIYSENENLQLSIHSVCSSEAQQGLPKLCYRGDTIIVYSESKIVEGHREAKLELPCDESGSNFDDLTPGP